ncbi:MAG TPA: hypothetical protein VME92_17025 [Acetobacteraceae bacterium]|nr:hypothetical protein [Acetobacteraceae bacterium]
MTRPDQLAEKNDLLPAPIQLTPDQLEEAAGGCGCGTVIIVVVRKGLPVFDAV